ncbi:MAG: vanadium-dependent haloperoxidase [Proteobacteria bacterium]|nr:vanadium-dependent haloperoxidase [Pseudomonadota bacterium]
MTFEIWNTRSNTRRLLGMTVLAAAALSACAGGDDGQAGQGQPVTIDAGTANTVSRFDEIATNTINQPNAATGTPEERQSNYAFDLATVHIAMYDAVIAIAGGYRPFYASAPASPTSGASQDAAAMAAAYYVLKALFPTRTATYQAAYDSALATITDADARAKGVALGAEVAATVVAARADDGRAAALPAFVPGTAPGAYRGPGTVGRSYPNVRPFALTSAAQFRTAAPLALSSAAYAADVNETRDLGGSGSSTRTAGQAEMARFHSEAPTTLWPRNLRRFMMTNRSLAEQARLGALLWVTHADATIACFESKYHYLAWRPFSAINLADTDDNAATTADPAWTPFLPTPGHPEYPAAHGCVSAAAAQVLRSFYGTTSVSFDFDSTASATTRHYASTDALVDEITLARIYGGMHFRTALVAGEAQGQSVSQYTLQNRFQAK